METTIRTAKFTPEERETHLWFDLQKGVWVLESNIQRHYNRAVRKGWEILYKDIYEDGQVCAMTLTAPEKAITIRSIKVDSEDNISDEEFLENDGAV